MAAATGGPGAAEPGRPISECYSESGSGLSPLFGNEPPREPTEAEALARLDRLASDLHAAIYSQSWHPPLFRPKLAGMLTTIDCLLIERKDAERLLKSMRDR